MEPEAESSAKDRTGAETESVESEDHARVGFMLQDDSVGRSVVIDQAFMLDGFKLAHRRFVEHVISHETDAPGAVYRALFETLAWTSSLDERLDYPDNPELRGVRFARNRVHHQWANALYITEGAMLPLKLPAALFEWRWRSVLPEGRPSRDEPIFMAHLADKPARLTLRAIAAFFESL